MTRVEIISFTGNTPAQVYYCDSMSANCVFVASVTTFPYSFDVPSPYDNNNFIVKITDSENCTIEEYVYILPSPTPTTTNTPFLTPSDTPTNTPTLTETPTPTITATPTQTSPVPTPSRTPAQTPLPPCDTPTPTPTAAVTPTPTGTVGASPTPTPTTTETPTQTSTNTPTTTQTSTVTPTNTETTTLTPTPTPSPTETSSPTPSVTETVTPTQTSTPAETSTQTPTPSVTETTTPTPTITPTNTVTPSITPAVEFVSFLFIDSNQPAVRTQLDNYMTSQGSTFRGFNINSPNLNNSTTFNLQMNSYVRYSGWGVSEPSIKTGATYNISRGFDNFGVPIVANRMTTTQIVSGTTTPNGVAAWYTWLVPTGATGAQRYSNFSRTFNNPTGTTVVTQRGNMSSILFNYTGASNIPNGVYRVYSSFTNTGFRITQNNTNIFFRGGTLI